MKPVERPSHSKKTRESIRSTPRPRDRKAQIVTAACALFAEKGYAAVSAEEIASAVGITGGALYRHVEGKQDLLVHGLVDALEAAADRIDATGRPDAESLVDALATVAFANRELGVLWGREVRSLDGDRRALVRTHFFRTFGLVSERLTALRPDLHRPQTDLLTWSVLASLTSIAYHRELLGPEVTGHLRRVTVAVCLTRLDSPPDERPASPKRGVAPAGRREIIIRAAAELFQQHGFRATSMSSIGDRIGLTGASIYRHFPGKTDVLGAIVDRALGALQVSLSQALASAADEHAALTGALDAYVGFATHSPELIDILLWETGNLPESDSADARRAQRAYLAEWESLLQRCRPGLSDEEARVIVAAVLTVINDAVRTASLRASPSLPSNLGRLGRAMLMADHDSHLSWNASKA